MKSPASKTRATPRPASKSITWTQIRQALTATDKPDLIALIKDLHDATDGNRDFLRARCLPAESGTELLEKYRRKITDQFFPARGYGKLNLREARQAIRDYRKASASVPGTAELLMTYVENGVNFTASYGDIDERFYSSVESVLSELDSLLRGQARSLYPHFALRLQTLVQKTAGIGWGFHDFIHGVVYELEQEFEPDGQEPPHQPS